MGRVQGFFFFVVTILDPAVGYTLEIPSPSPHKVPSIRFFRFPVSSAEHATHIAVGVAWKLNEGIFRAVYFSLQRELGRDSRDVHASNYCRVQRY